MLAHKVRAFGYLVESGYAKHLEVINKLKSTALFYVRISTQTFQVRRSSLKSRYVSKENNNYLIYNIMKKLFFVMATTIGICYIMPTVNAMSNAISTDVYTCIQTNADPKVGDYTACAGSGVGAKFINIAVYSYANSCYSYYAIIDGESYAVRENPDYQSKSSTNGRRYSRTHYVQYKNERYYFSI